MVTIREVTENVPNTALYTDRTVTVQAMAIKTSLPKITDERYDILIEIETDKETWIDS